MSLPNSQLIRIATRGPKTVGPPRTMVTDLTAMFAEMLAEASILRWPSDRYADDPVRFCTEVLGFEPWYRQAEILNALRDHSRVSVTSGHKCGKSRVATAAGLWFYSSFLSEQPARVFLSSARAQQIESILWTELSRLFRGSGRCLDCRLRDPKGPRPCEHSTPLDGLLAARSTTGLRSDDDRRILGITAKVAEGVQGYSGPQLWILDEASGIDDPVFEVVEGNMMGGRSKVLMLGNPTRNKGEFFESHNNAKKSKAYYRVQMSSEEAAKARDSRGLPIPFLASQTEVEERRELWGEDSPLYKVRIKGEFALHEDGCIFSVGAIAEAIERWDEDPGVGRLYIGVDPAGATGTGDDSAFAIRRGTKLLRLVTSKNLDEDGHLRKILALVEEHRVGRETPVIVVDREGSIGSVLHSRIVEYLDAFRAPRRPPWEYVPVKASNQAERMPNSFPRVRDELHGNLERWFRTGSIPDDDDLSKELNSVHWIPQIDQRSKATPKDELRKLLGRSPDRMDALMLSVWEPLSLRVGADESLPPSAAAAVAKDRARLDRARTPAGGWEGGGGWGEWEGGRDSEATPDPRRNRPGRGTLRGRR